MKHPVIAAIARIDGAAVKILRMGIAIVFIWIGSLKYFAYEADGIVPFVANSPFMLFFYNTPADYKQHVNKEGEFVAHNHLWHEQNNTYGFSNGLGVVLIALGILVLLHKVAPLWSLAGSILIFLMTLGTLSFLFTTPESWVPALGDAQHGFPYLSGRGRLVVKDVVILGAALVTMSDTAKFYLKKHSN